MKVNVNQPIKQFLGKWEQTPIFLWVVSIGWMLLIAWLGFFWKLGGVGLVDETEPLFAEAARQMWVTRDWITPYFNDATRFDKPPLIYWLMAIAYQMFGVNEFAVRLPSALAAIALMIMGFYVLQRFGNTTLKGAADGEQVPAAASPQSAKSWLTAWIGASAIAINVQTIAWGRIGVSDMVLSGCMGTALLAFFCGYTQPRQPLHQARWYLAVYTLLGLAVLAKGPVGLVIPSLIIGAFLLYTGNFSTGLRELRVWKGAAIIGIITLPWYVAVTWLNGQDFIEDFFGYHNFERFTSVVNHHAAPWYFYFGVVLVGFIPWSIYLPVAIAQTRFWQRQRWQNQPRHQQLGLFALVWFAVIFLFFTVAVTKLPSYVIPLIPAAAILVALLWSNEMTQPSLSRGVKISSWIQVGVAVLLAGAVRYSLNWMGGDLTMPDLPQLMHQSSILTEGSLIWLMVAAISGLLLVFQQGRWLWSVSLIGFAAFLVVSLMPTLVIVDSQRQLPLRELAQTLVRVHRPHEPIVMTGFGKPSVVFYAQRPVTFRSSPDAAVKHMREYAFETGVPSGLLLGHPEEIEAAPLRPRQYRRLGTSGRYELVRIRFPRARQAHAASLQISPSGNSN